MDLRKVLIQSRKLPAQHVEGLWENIYKHNVKAETLSSILAFYLHHRVYPPPVQKAFDTLLIAFTGAKVPRKLRILLFQTVEEMCHWLNPSCITETVKLSTSPSAAAGLLPCFLINKDIPHPSNTVYEWLISSLTSPGLCLEDRAKVLSFVMTTVSVDLQPLLNKQLTSWLSYSRSPQTTGGLFRSLDVTELDGSPGLGICTALTLVSNITDLHYLSLAVFSNIRWYLYRTRECVDEALINATCGYCSALLAQASKRPNNIQDKLLVASVLEEVLLVLRAVREVDNSSSGKCQLMVGNLQHLADQLRLTTLLVSVWEYQLVLGEESSLTDRVLGNIIKSEFSQGQVSHRLATILANHGSILTKHLVRYAPSIFKLIATHPSTLVEEFMEIVLSFDSDIDLISEVFHSLLDLPTLSSSICVHQSSLLVQAGFKVPVLLSLRQQVETEPNLNSVYKHMLRTKAQQEETDGLLKLYPDFWMVLRPLLSLGLVEVCSQITPLLLEVFLDSTSNSLEANKVLLPAIFSRVPLLCPIPTYQKAVFDVLSKYVTKLSSLQPELIEDSSIIQFLSVANYCQLCPQLFKAVVTAVGEQIKTEQVVLNCFETLEAILCELIQEKTSKDLKLETSICTTLAKLASRNVVLIPRAITAFDKLTQKLQNTPGEEKEAFLQHTREIISVLKNPRLASVVLTPSSKEDNAMAALVRVLFQFLD